MDNDQIALCSEALILVGANPIDSVVGDETEQIIAARLFDTTVQYCISLHPWRWATRSYQLSRNGAEPIGRFTASYGLPAGTQRVLAVRINNEPIDFDRYEAELHCDAQEIDLVIAEVVIIPAVAFWPGYFRSFVVNQLASVFAVPVTEDASKAQMYQSAARMALTAGKTADSQGRTARKMPVGSLRRLVGLRR